MPYYMFHGRYTTASLKAMVEKPQDREAASRELLEALGCKMHHFFFCFGQDDVMALIEAPDDKTMAAGALAVGAGGALAGGATTKLMTSAEAMQAMEMARSARGSYRPPA